MDKLKKKRTIKKIDLITTNYFMVKNKARTELADQCTLQV